MPRQCLVLLVWLALAVPALAGTDAARAVSAAPGVRLTLDFTPPGSPGEPPLLLDVELQRPLDASESGPLRWTMAAWPGVPAQAAWEFAFPWEVRPGPWRLAVFHQGGELAHALYEVAGASQDPEPVAPGPVPPPQGKPGSQPKRPGPGAEAGGKAPSAPAQARPLEAAGARQEAKAVPGDTPARQAQPSLPGPAKAPPAQPPAPAPGDAGVKAPASGKRPVGGAPSRQVFALVAGSYSEEARALWVATFLRTSGWSACVRQESPGGGNGKPGRKLWSVVAGWRDTRDEARQARDELARVTGDALVRPMSAGELEKGLICR